MGQKRDHERALFAAFLRVLPDFAGESLEKWHQPEDEREFPDIIGTSPRGRKIGVELGEWLNQEEMRAAKERERVEKHILEVLGEQGRNPTEHIQYVSLNPKPKIHIAPDDQSRFRADLVACILECDRRWPNERFWQRGHELVGAELAAFPLLTKYLDGVRLWPADGSRLERHWIMLPAHVEPFDTETMREPLRRLVTEKIGHYGAERTGFDDLSLVVIYNRAWIYNSPAETHAYRFEDAAVELRELIAHNRGPFDRVFLYLALEPGRVIRVL